MDLADLVRLYGYPAIVLGTMIQGEVILMICGLLASRGYLSVWLVGLTAVVAAALGDIIYFSLGRRFGDRLIARLSRRLRASVNSARHLIERHPRQILLYMRFIFGMRIILPIMCGTADIRLRQFIFYNVISAIIWATLFVGAGYLFGAAVRRFIGTLEEIKLWFVLVLIGAAIIYHFAARHYSRRWTDYPGNPSTRRRHDDEPPRHP